MVTLGRFGHECAQSRIFVRFGPHRQLLIEHPTGLASRTNAPLQVLELSRRARCRHLAILGFQLLEVLLESMTLPEGGQMQHSGVTEGDSKLVRHIFTARLRFDGSNA
jgi:hypothetical protein